MTDLEYLGLVILLPLAGLIIAGILLRITSRDAAREDRRIAPGE